MESNEPLIPRRYQRIALATAMILALTAGGVWVGNYVLSVLQQRQRDAALAIQQAAAQAQLEANDIHRVVSLRSPLAEAGPSQSA
jgi:hypothetical protein